MAYTGPNTIVANLTVEIESAASRYAEINGRLAAADGDKDKAREAWIKDSTDPDAVKIREGIAKLIAKIEALAEERVVVETLSDDDKAKLSVEAATLKEQVTKGQKAVGLVLASVPTDVEGVNAWLKDFKEKDATRSKRGRTVGTPGSALPRVNVNVTITGGNFTEPQKFDSFAPACQKLKFPVKDMQEAFAKAAGVAHEDIKDVKVPVTFTIKPHENGAEYTVETSPKETKKPGRKAKDETKAAAVEAPKAE